MRLRLRNESAGVDSPACRLANSVLMLLLLTSQQLTHWPAREPGHSSPPRDPVPCCAPPSLSSSSSTSGHFLHPLAPGAQTCPRALIRCSRSPPTAMNTLNEDDASLSVQFETQESRSSNAQEREPRSERDMWLMRLLGVAVTFLCVCSSAG